jgi:hypothetical protein
MKRFFVFALIFIVVGEVNFTNVTQAQSFSQPESISGAHFIKLNYEQKRIFARNLMNKSQLVEIPDEFGSSAREFYLTQVQNEQAYLKYKELFRPLFNHKTHRIDIINYCSFLLENFPEDEIPLQLVRTRQAFLINNIGN